MSSNPDQILTAFADRIAGYTVETLGRDNVLSIFLAGSVARGEITAAEISGVVEIYSDIDLYVVVSEGVDIERARRTIREFARGVPRETGEYRVMAPPDVGVYSRALLEAQPARPGTVEIEAAHRVLYGNKDIPRESGRFRAAAIAPGEGLYLLENRLSEIAESGGHSEAGDPASRRLLHYMLLKSCQDLLSAVLIALGRFKASRAERAAVLDDPEFRAEAEDLLTAAAAHAICSSGGILLNPRGRIELDANALANRRGDVVSMLLDGWRRIAEWISGGEGWARMVDWRCRAGNWSVNSRELFRLGKRLSVPRARLLLHAGRLGRLSPVEALRMAGLVGLLFEYGDLGGIALGAADRDALERRYAAHLDALTEEFGIRSGSVFERGRILFGKTA